MATAKKKVREERKVQVSLPLSTAADLVTVLQKFSTLQMEKLLHGDKKRADRLLALNLFRADVEKELNENR